jgi:hypothetical protein
MNLRCFLFGHRPAFGYGGREGDGYFTQRVGQTDGMGRTHVYLDTTCERCGDKYQVGIIHALTDSELKSGGK